MKPTTDAGSYEDVADCILGGYEEDERRPAIARELGIAEQRGYLKGRMERIGDTCIELSNRGLCFYGTKKHPDAEPVREHSELCARLCRLP